MPKIINLDGTVRIESETPLDKLARVHRAWEAARISTPQAEALLTLAKVDPTANWILPVAAETSARFIAMKGPLNIVNGAADGRSELRRQAEQRHERIVEHAERILSVRERRISDRALAAKVCDAIKEEFARATLEIVEDDMRGYSQVQVRRVISQRREKSWIIRLDDPLGIQYVTVPEADDD